MTDYNDDSLTMDKRAEGISDILEKSNHPFFAWKYLIIFILLDSIFLSFVALGA